MAVKRTEQQHPMAGGLDLQPPEAVLRFLAEAQIEAAGAVLGAIDSDRAGSCDRR